MLEKYLHFNKKKKKINIYILIQKKNQYHYSSTSIAV